MANKKVYTNSLLQVRRPFKALSLNVCSLCMGSGESVDHLFLYCPTTLKLWHKPFRLVSLAWVPPRSVSDMLTISFRIWGTLLEAKVLWKITCFLLIWIVWRERNVRIFEDKWRSIEMIWDLVYFHLSFWASITKTF